MNVRHLSSLARQPTTLKAAQQEMGQTRELEHSYIIAQTNQASQLGLWFTMVFVSVCVGCELEKVTQDMPVQ
jgi:hypothetical protein